MKDLGIFGLIAVLLSVISFGATLEVGPGKPYSKIQAAIDAANPGDTVLVWPGTYEEQIFIDQDIAVTSTYPLNPFIVETTIVKGWLEFSGSEDPNCIFAGFTVTGTKPLPPGWEGATIAGFGTHAKIDYCVIRNGQGITRCDGIISNCRIVNNYKYGTYDFASPVFGAGLNDCDGTILNCIIADNEIEGAGKGVGLYDCDGTIINCTITRNVGSDNGAAEQAWGGGLASCNGTIKNCIITNNFGLYGNNFYSCSAPAYSCFPEADGSNGNIAADPLFVDPDSGDFHLRSQYGRWDPNVIDDNGTPTDPNDDFSIGGMWFDDAVTSPCIDAGDPNDSRWQNELWPHGERINMGAYGGTAQASMSGNSVGNIADLDHDGGVDLGDWSLWADDWLRERILLDSDLDRDNDVDPNDLMLFVNEWMWRN